MAVVVARFTLQFLGEVTVAIGRGRGWVGRARGRLIKRLLKTRQPNIFVIILYIHKVQCTQNCFAHASHFIYSYIESLIVTTHIYTLDCSLLFLNVFMFGTPQKNLAVTHEMIVPKNKPNTTPPTVPTEYADMQSLENDVSMPSGISIYIKCIHLKPSFLIA